jgi:hypothetical protein
MRNIFLSLFTACVLLSSSARAQFTFSDIKYWVGTGSDSAMLVIDFHDGSFWDTCYAWGYRYNGPATGEDMLIDIAAADTNLSVAISGGFLNDIIYGNHTGIGGNPDYWGTWSGTSTATWTMNAGISTPLVSGEWFGCGYTDFNPALAPGEPIAAFEPFFFTKNDVVLWTGTGSDTTILVIDFLTGSGLSSFAWGYAHNGPVTAETMLNDIDANDPQLSVAIAGGFLNDIVYNSWSGIGGNPNYWATWSGSNLGTWDMNMGISTLIGNNDYFGCSYTDFAPAVRPGYPVAANPTLEVIDEQDGNGVSVYPIPSLTVLNVVSETQVPQLITITSLSGNRVYEKQSATGTEAIDVSEFAAGMYILRIGATSKRITIQ